MSLIATVTITVDLIGDGWTLTPPNSLGTPVVNTGTPGDLFPIQIMASNNALLIPKAPMVVQYLFIDPTAANGGMAFTLKGIPTDVGVGISSANPSLIPAAAQAVIPNLAGPTILNFTEYYLQSTAAGQLNIGWI
jgi:hypothetical protein